MTQSERENFFTDDGQYILLTPKQMLFQSEPPKKYVRPPLGIMPEFIWKEKRIEDIKQAIVRCVKAEYAVPRKWIEEWLRLDREVKELLKAERGEI